MALFEHSDEAVAAARDMRAASDALGGTQPLRIGIGLHTGPLMLGTIGGQDRLDTGVVGDAVNTAARIESLTKQYEQPLLFSGASKAACPEDLEFVEVDRVAPKGKREQVTLFTVSHAA